MQRNRSHQKPLSYLVYIALYVLYSSLASIYLFLPPLLSVLYLLFSKALDSKNILLLLSVSFCLLVFEANFGYMAFSSILYFYLLYKIIMPKIVQNFSCYSCIKISIVVLAYLGYFLFLTLFSNIFMLEAPEISYYIIYYIVIEFFFVSLL